MTTETLLMLMAVLLVGLIGAVAWLIVQVRLLNLMHDERARRDEQDEIIEAILTGVRGERQEGQMALASVERNLSQAMANLTSFVMDQQQKSASEVRSLNETARQSLAETREVMHRQLMELQTLVDQRFARIIEANAHASEHLGSRLEGKFNEIRTTVDANLDKVRTANEAKLEEMRATVQEKLDRTLADRLTASFKTVDEKLGLVQTGLGEMRQMAASVRDLKGVLTNVKTRGTFGETQLETILSNILTPNQFASQVRVIPGSNQVVDFAVRMPGAGTDAPCWLPIDSKFPVEDYGRLLEAEEAADAQKAAQARSGLEKAVLVQAKSIHDKYVKPPYTTEFAVMYLPSEGLYAEVIRIPGLFERLQRDYRITPAGPTVVSALINSLQMGFVTLALQERSSEVWKVLGEVKGEFLAFAEGFAKVQKKFSEAQSSLDAMKTRQNVMQKKMSAIETGGLLTDTTQTLPMVDKTVASDTEITTQGLN
ncbi:MAG: DNA recombination protein RmuC [Sutterella wadsworthensis]|nr:DNA recombination protein RmuC [Sutterella wadsworthensis]